MKINVLDHGYVQLVDSMGSDLSVVRSARVSHDADWRVGSDHGSDERLIRYLARHRHTSPFESVVFTFEVGCPIFIARQWMRHRTWCLAGHNRVHFRLPSGKIYYKTIKELADLWYAPLADVQRPDNQARTRRDFNRDRIRSMQVECIEGNSPALTTITDVIVSGVKDVFTLTSTSGKEITCSEDHLFNTPNGWKPLKDLSPGDSIFTVAKIAPEEIAAAPPFTADEIAAERWAEIADGVSVSSLGRASRHGVIVDPTIATNGRAVIAVKTDVWRATQLSKLVIEAFGPPGTGHVLHRDDCPTNNRLDNLYYGTDQDNHDDARRNGRRAFNGVTVLVVDTIEPAGREMTYDLSVASPEHNFIAEGFCVHNSYNEVSARYTPVSTEFYVPAVETIGLPSDTNKQGRTFGKSPNAEHVHDCIRIACDFSVERYRELLEKGCPRELARTVLPQGMYTRFFTTVNLHNLTHFIRLRDHDGAQWEIQQYAVALREIASKIAPISVEALMA